MTPPHLPAVPPPPYITGRLVGGAILIAAVQGNALRQRDNYRAFLALGVEALEGRNLWSDEPDAEPADEARAESFASEPLAVHAGTSVCSEEECEADEVHEHAVALK